MLVGGHILAAVLKALDQVKNDSLRLADLTPLTRLLSEVYLEIGDVTGVDVN